MGRLMLMSASTRSWCMPARSCGQAGQGGQGAAGREAALGEQRPGLSSGEGGLLGAVPSGKDGAGEAGEAGRVSSGAAEPTCRLRPWKMSEHEAMRSSCSPGATMPSSHRSPRPPVPKEWVGSMLENLRTGKEGETMFAM